MSWDVTQIAGGAFEGSCVISVTGTEFVGEVGGNNQSKGSDWIASWKQRRKSGITRETVQYGTFTWVSKDELALVILGTDRFEYPPSKLAKGDQTKEDQNKEDQTQKTNPDGSYRMKRTS